MRLASLFFIGALLVSFPASAALTVTEPPSDPGAMDSTRYSAEADARMAEEDANFRVAERRRAKRSNDMLKVLYIVAPLVVFLGGALVLGLTRRKQGGISRSELRKLKKAAQRRRAGGPPRELDPRQW
jgi:hypothetical protein